jgi:beta-lactam-binding protein with PASTA domain
MKRKKTRRVFTNEERQAYVEQYDGLTPDEHTPWLEANGFNWQTIRRFRRLVKGLKSKKPTMVTVQGLPLEEAVQRLEVRGLPAEAGISTLMTREVLSAYIDVKRSEYRMLGKFLGELENLVK